MARRRGVVWSLALLALITGAYAVLRAVTDDNDFHGFHAGARFLLEHGRFSTAHAVERYLPTFTALLLPFGALPLGLAAALWYLLNLAALLALPREIERLSGVTPRQQAVAWWLALPLILNNFALGQSGPLLLFGALWALARAREGRAARAGFVLGLCALFKLLPAALCLVPLALGRARRTLAGLTLALLAGGALCVAAAGPEATVEAVRAWRAAVGGQSPWGLVEAGRSLRFNNQALGVTLATTLGDLEGRVARGRVDLADWPLPVVWGVYLALVAAGAGLLAAILRAVRRAPGPRGWLIATGATSVLMLMASPLVWTHYFLWLLPALVALHERRRALWILGVVANLAFAVPVLRGLGLHMALAMAMLPALHAVARAAVVRASCAGEGGRAPAVPH